MESYKKDVQKLLMGKFYRYLDFTNFSGYLKKNKNDNIWRFVENLLEENKNDEILYFVANLIDAKCNSKIVECIFNNEFLHGNNRSDDLFIYGKASLDLEGDLLLHNKPSDKFEYKMAEHDFSEHAEDVKIINIDDYDGSFSYAGIIQVYNGENFVDFQSTKLFNEVKYYLLESESSIWRKYVLESYRFYRVGSFQTAFLMLFIALDSLIELLIEELRSFYENKFQSVAISAMKNYLKEEKNYIIDFINENFIKGPLREAIDDLDNKKRKLILQKLDQILELCSSLTNDKRGTVVKEFKFFEDVRNILAHGKYSDIEKLKSEYGIAQKFIINDELKFDKLYVRLFIEIVKLIQQICGGVDIFNFKKNKFQ